MTENNLETMERMLRAVALLAERDALSTTASTDGMRGQHISILAPEWRAGVWIAPADRADRMVIRYCVTPLPKRDEDNPPAHVAKAETAEGVWRAIQRYAGCKRATDRARPCRTTFTDFHTGTSSLAAHGAVTANKGKGQDMLTIEDYQWIMDKVRNIEAADNALSYIGVQINRRRIETYLHDHFEPDVHVHLHLKDCNADAGQLAFAVSPSEENVGRHRVNIVRVTLTDIDPPPPPPPLVNVTLKYDSAFVRGLFHSNAPEPTTV